MNALWNLPTLLRLPCIFLLLLSYSLPSLLCIYSQSSVLSSVSRKPEGLVSRSPSRVIPVGHSPFFGWGKYGFSINLNQNLPARAA
jgi:hypothetical protein